MRIKHAMTAVVASAVFVTYLSAFPFRQQGSAPSEEFGARDVSAEYNLPPLKNRATDSLRRAEQHTQVLTRAEHLALNQRSATTAWRNAGQIYASGTQFASVEPPPDPVMFSGTFASELNTLLASPNTRSVKVISPSLEIDVPISISRTDLDIDFAEAELVSARPQAFLVKLIGAERIRLRGGVFSGAAWGMLLSHTRNVAISAVRVQHARGGVLVTDSQDVVIRNNEFHFLEETPILLHGDSHRVLIVGNDISGNSGKSNWDAGVVVSDRIADLAEDPRSLLRSDHYGVQEQLITTRLAIPTNNLIALNRITGNSSSGIYSDGGSANVFAENSVEGNSKEGFCLDNGSTANVVIFNVIRMNGKRWGNTDSDLQNDFVLNLGRLPDGTSPAKLPGISVDNSAYNEVMFNNINDNYGGGIKMVRTAFYNILGMNTLNENNEGRSRLFHFFGIELGSATADVKVPDLDFRPSRGNQIFGNTIRGKHYAGIFFAVGSDENSVFDNAIFGATDWAMESIQQEKNQSFNNLSNLRSRNISTGLDPKLVLLGSGR